MYIGSTGPRGLHHLVYEVRRQLGRRGDRRLLRQRPRRPAPGQQLHGHRRRPRHPGRRTEEREAARGRGRADHAARRRQVRRRRRLQSLRRPARRRRLGRQRALRAAPPRDQPRRRTSGPRTTSAASRRPTSTEGEASDATGTTITFLPDDEIFDELEFDYATLAERLRETAFLTRGLKIELVDERGAGQQRHLPLRGRHRRLRRPPQREQGRRCTARRSSSRARPTTARSRSRCSGTPPTRNRSSASPTTSTPTRAAPTSPASARR